MTRLDRVLSCGLLAVALGAVPAAAQDTHLLIVAGLGGEPEYAEAFRSWSSALQSSAEKRLGIPRANIIYLTENPDKDPGRVDARATRDELAKALARVAQKSRPGDTVAIILFGHGSGMGEEARFNLPGPDASARDFASWLAPLTGRKLVFINTASASGDFQKVLAGRNRVILTSTKSSQERNESVFGKYFSEALAGDTADVDKNGRVSILEAFDSAKTLVTTEYQRERRLLTEHAVLEDGDSGANAKATFLGRNIAEASDQNEATDDPALALLQKERRAIEDSIEALKATKGGVPSEQYEQDLERLLLDLALKNEEIRKKRAGGVR